MSINSDERRNSVGGKSKSLPSKFVTVLTLLGLFNVFWSNAQNVSENRNNDGPTFEINLNWKGSTEQTWSNSIPLNLNNYVPAFDDKWEIEKNKSDFIKLALKRGLDLNSLFPNGLWKSDRFFSYPLDVIIAEAEKLARVHWCIYDEELSGVVEMICSFLNNWKLELDEDHSIDLSVFPGVDVNDLNNIKISSYDWSILLSYHDGKKYVLMKLLNFWFVLDTFFYSCIKRLEDFLNSRGSDAEFAAIDLGRDVEELKTLSWICENDTKSEASTPEEKQTLSDMWEAIHVASIEFGFTPRQERLLWACINWNLKFWHWYIYVPDVDGSLNTPGVCYAFSAEANVEELRQYINNWCPVIYTWDVWILPWWVRYWFDWKMSEDGDSSPKDSIYNTNTDQWNSVKKMSDDYIYNWVKWDW